MKKIIVILTLVLLLTGCSAEIQTFIPPPNISGEVQLRYPTAEIKYIALTFDDGPNSTYTPRILDILLENDAKATFFMLGLEISEDTQDVVLRVYEEGHEIGNHTENHQSFNKIDIETGKEQLSLTDNKILEITGELPTLVRPPFGTYSDSLPTDYDRPFILWNLDPEDWNNRDAGYITEHILENAKSGDIIVMHDRFESTADALEQFLPLLKAKGFEFVTVSTLIEIAEGEVENSIYRSADISR